MSVFVTYSITRKERIMQDFPPFTNNFRYVYVHHCITFTLKRGLEFISFFLQINLRTENSNNVCKYITDTNFMNLTLSGFPKMDYFFIMHVRPGVDEYPFHKLIPIRLGRCGDHFKCFLFNEGSAIYIEYREIIFFKRYFDILF